MMEQKNKFEFTKTRWLIATLFLITAVAFIYYKLTSAKSTQPNKGANIPPAVLVEVRRANLETWPVSIQATGSLKAIRGTTIKSEVSGRITRIFFQSGSYVKTGTPLVETNPEVLQAEVNQAQAIYKLAENTYKRNQQLYTKDVISLQERDQALSDRDKARASWEKSKAELNQIIIRAPFSGKVGLSLIEVGDYLQPGTDITNIQALNPLRVDFMVPEDYLPYLKINLPVILKSSAYPNLSFEAKVYAIDAEINVETRSVAVRAQVPNPLQQLLPGMFVQTTLQLNKGIAAITIPAVCVVYDADGSYVYRISSSNIAQRVPITLGERRDDKIAIRQGLQENDQVVIAGQLKLSDGVKVMIKK